ncbi:FimD/PapC N-terminal domain-containing protein, partial [Escherichia sp. R-CC3]
MTPYLLNRIATFCALLYCNSAFCAELVEYDHTFLMGQNASNIDLSRYSEGNPAIPGMYDVSVYVNDQQVQHRKHYCNTAARKT